LRGPFSSWVSRNVVVDDASSIVCEDDKDEQDFKPNGVDREEVDGSELSHVIVEKCSPRLRRCFGTADHVFGHRGLRNLDVQLHEFAVNARSSPDRVLSAHCSNQIASFLRNWRTPLFAVTHLPSPIPTKSLTMPADDGFRFDNNEG